MPEFNYIVEILARYPSINAEEENTLKEWREKDQNEDLFQQLTNNENKIALLERLNAMKNEEGPLWRRFHSVNFIPALSEKSKTAWWRTWPTYAAAASIIIIAAVGIKYFETKKADVAPAPAVVAQNNDVQPGSYKAQLTLDDGSVVNLDKFSGDSLVHQGRTNVYNKDGQLVYRPQGDLEGKILYNTLATSKGQMYSTVLSDGSKVWLNSQSSIRYPVSFVNNRREVEITGEAYFEVAHHVMASGAKEPFIVKMQGVEIEVLGTHFNVNSYGDENDIKTTLLEGKVKMHATSNDAAVVLEPGQQGKLEITNNRLTRVNNADVDEATAWKNGYFQFNDVQLKTVLSQIARWYDVDVVYQGKVPEKTFWGKISRTNTLSQVLTAIEHLGVKCTIQGRKLIVSS